jgi:hypothetical protein
VRTTFSSLRGAACAAAAAHPAIATAITTSSSELQCFCCCCCCCCSCPNGLTPPRCSFEHREADDDPNLAYLCSEWELQKDEEEEEKEDLEFFFAPALEFTVLMLMSRLPRTDTSRGRTFQWAKVVITHQKADSFPKLFPRRSAVPFLLPFFFASKENREKLLSSDELYSLSDLVLQFQSDTTTTTSSSSSSKLCLFRCWVFFFFFFLCKGKIAGKIHKTQLDAKTNKQTNKQMMTTRIPETLTLKTKFRSEFPSFFLFFLCDVLRAEDRPNCKEELQVSTRISSPKKRFFCSFATILRFLVAERKLSSALVTMPSSLRKCN